MFCEIFKNKQSNLKLEDHSLIQSVETRWNSTYIMLERLYEQISAVNGALLDKNSKCENLFINADEISLISGYLNVLSCFYEATKEFSASKYITLSIVIPTFNSIINNLQQEEKNTKVVCI